MRSPGFFAVLLVPVLVACDPASPSACDAAAEIDATISIGVGEQSFAPVSDGEDVGLVRGSQGGLMVLGALEVTGIVQGIALFGDEDNPLVDFQLRAEDDTVIGGYAGLSRHFVRDADDVFTLVGETVVLDAWGLEELASPEVTLSARIADACGRELAATRAVTLVDG
ncbi:MAG: hypothetical protein Q8P18_05600 [Pseudomonadota bacterium]|nr:hypothetical protein [Pseudomonadota bacterium]